MAAPTIRMNNGLHIPVFGLGTWQASPGEVGEAVKNAIECGYRHIDCAHFYGNEKEIGQAIREKIEDGTVKRENLFITSKLWNNSHRPDLVIPACKRSLADFGLEYLDLYLVHWPFAYAEETGDLLPTDESGKIIGSDVDYLDTWKEMEHCVKSGLVKSIGMSNFNTEQIDRLLQVATIKPVTNQVEVHPYMNNKKLVAFCKDKDITVTSYFPLGSPSRPWAKPDEPVLLEDPKLREIAKSYNKSIAQIILRYLVDIGTIPVPKSSNKERMRMNIDIFDFELSPEDIKLIDTFNRNFRINQAERDIHLKYYPFGIEY
ncbi:Aldo-keto reductase 1B [Carabus blaptoides fortunei]